MPIRINSSGGGSVTIDAPVTASNYTVTAPTEAGNYLVADATGAVNVTTNSGVVTVGPTAASTALALRSSNTERVRITSSGNVGIGTNNPGDRLHVNENASYVGIKLQNQSSFLTTFVHDGLGGHGFIYKSGNLDTVFYNNDVETARIKAGGNFQMNSGYGSVATAYGCRAWVNFNGSGGVSIRGSGNVASVVRIGNGFYYLTFTNNMPDINFCMTGSANITDGNFGLVIGDEISSRTVNKTGTFYTVNTASVNNAADANNINIAIFR